jgi:hypothetical protein
MSKVYTFSENTPLPAVKPGEVRPINRPEPREVTRFYAITAQGVVGFAKTSQAKTKSGLRSASRKLHNDTFLTGTDKVNHTA